MESSFRIDFHRPLYIQQWTVPKYFVIEPLGPLGGSFTERDELWDVQPKSVAPPYSLNRCGYSVHFWVKSTSSGYKWRHCGDFWISISNRKYWLFFDFPKSANFSHLKLIFSGLRGKFENRHGGAIYIHLMYSQPKNYLNSSSGLGCRGGATVFSVCTSYISSLSVNEFMMYVQFVYISSWFVKYCAGIITGWTKKSPFSRLRACWHRLVNHDLQRKKNHYS